MDTRIRSGSAPAPRLYRRRGPRARGIPRLRRLEEKRRRLLRSQASTGLHRPGNCTVDYPKPLDLSFQRRHRPVVG